MKSNVTGLPKGPVVPKTQLDVTKPVEVPIPDDRQRLLDPQAEAPTGAFTGSSTAPLVGQSQGAGARLHELERDVPTRRHGKRTSALKTRKIDWFQRQLRRPAVREAFRELHAKAKATGAPALGAGLVEAFKLAGLPKPDAAVAALQKTGLDKLLSAGLERGRITERMASDDLSRLGEALKNRTLAADDIKIGLVALDDAAQLLSGALGKGGAFGYDHTLNRARDLMITFARSLHR